MSAVRLFGLHVEAENFAGFTFGEDFEGAATDLAIGGEALRAQAGIDYQIEFLPAERALDWRGDFHDRCKVVEAVPEVQREWTFEIPRQRNLLRIKIRLEFALRLH